MDGVVHAAGLAGELFSAEERDTLVNDGDLQAATAKVATSATGARSPRPRDARLDGRARHDVRADARCHPAQPGGVRCPHAARPFAAGGLRPRGGPVRRGGRRARRCRRGVRISAGSDHVAYGPISERASLFGELQLLVDSIALSPTAALARRHARRRPGHRRRARHAGSARSRPATTPTWCSSARIRWTTSRIWKSVELGDAGRAGSGGRDSFGAGSRCGS